MRKGPGWPCSPQSWWALSSRAPTIGPKARHWPSASGMDGGAEEQRMPRARSSEAVLLLTSFGFPNRKAPLSWGKRGLQTFVRDPLRGFEIYNWREGVVHMSICRPRQYSHFLIRKSEIPPKIPPVDLDWHGALLWSNLERPENLHSCSRITTVRCRAAKEGRQPWLSAPRNAL